MSNADKLIETARAEVGYLEKRTNAELESRTGNAGSANYTKYARDYTGWTGQNYQGMSWCAMFVSWCFATAFGTDGAEKLVLGLHASCTEWWTKLRAAGQTVSAPEAGDLIFFKSSSGGMGHIGIVRAVSGETVYTVEGNTSGASGVVENGGGVAEKSYSKAYSRIGAYARPVWSAVPETGSADVYTVQRGDTLTKIARACKSTVREIKELNGIEDANRIETGQVLMLSESAEAAAQALQERGVIDSAAYWIKKAVTMDYLGALLLKAARTITGAGDPCGSVDEALKALESAGVIDSPEYWRNHAGDVEYLDALLKKLGGSVNK